MAKRKSVKRLVGEKVTRRLSSKAGVKALRKAARSLPKAQRKIVAKRISMLKLTRKSKSK